MKAQPSQTSSPEGLTGAELVLEPSSRAPARASQKALYDAVFPATVLSTNDIAVEYQRWKSLGVKFRGRVNEWVTATCSAPPPRE